MWRSLLQIMGSRTLISHAKCTTTRALILMIFRLMMMMMVLVMKLAPSLMVIVLEVVIRFSQATMFVKPDEVAVEEGRCAGTGCVVPKTSLLPRVQGACPHPEQCRIRSVWRQAEWRRLWQCRDSAICVAKP